MWMVPGAQQLRGLASGGPAPYLEVEDQVVQLDGVGKVQLDRDRIHI